MNDPYPNEEAVNFLAVMSYVVGDNIEERGLESVKAGFIPNSNLPPWIEFGFANSDMLRPSPRSHLAYFRQREGAAGQHRPRVEPCGQRAGTASPTGVPASVPGLIPPPTKSEWNPRLRCRGSRKGDLG
jgi:hypothetical protein